MFKETFEEAKLEIGLFDAKDILTESNTLDEEEELGIPQI
jgi:hypothetical protein